MISNQRIVHKGSNATALISAIAWLSSSGALDIGAEPDTLIHAAMRRKLSLDDHGVVALAISLLREVYPTLKTRLATLKPPDTSSVAAIFGRVRSSLGVSRARAQSSRCYVQASQTFLEVKLDQSSGEWTAFDLDNDVQPLVAGRPCSVQALSRSCLGGGGNGRFFSVCVERRHQRCSPFLSAPPLLKHRGISFFDLVACLLAYQLAATTVSMFHLAADTQLDNSGLMAFDGNRSAPVDEPRPLARPWIHEMIKVNLTRWYCQLARGGSEVHGSHLSV